MLAAAPKDSCIIYVRSAAESLPFVDKSFDLITVALAFHWFDRASFLSECSRLLSPGAWLVIYDNGFRGQMRQNALFERWILNVFLPRFPSPPRDRTPLTDSSARASGFEVVARETYNNSVRFTRDELVDYLMTQSNLIAAIEEGTESVATVRDWLMNSLRTYFHGDDGEFLFGGPITFLRRTV